MTAQRAGPGSAFEGQVFSTPQARCRRFTEWVLGHVEASRAISVLDIGCGDGAQVLHLAGALPNATLTGVDISARNVAAAGERARRLGLESRVVFVASDYLQFRSPPRDLIVSYSTLQLIAADSRVLFRKIADELVEGGLLMNVMPHECVYNRLLMAARRGLAAIRSAATDELVFRIGKLIHGRELSDELIRERIAYMYQPLERLDGPALRALMKDECGLDFVAGAPEVHASLAQAKHRLLVFRKHGAAR